MQPMSEKKLPIHRNQLYPHGTLREEKKRLFLRDNEPPSRSVFNLGDFRHEKDWSQNQMADQNKKMNEGRAPSSFTGAKMSISSNRGILDWSGVNQQLSPKEHKVTPKI